jgi:hypothetical protein
VILDAYPEAIAAGAVHDDYLEFCEEVGKKSERAYPPAGRMTSFGRPAVHLGGARQREPPALRNSASM